MAYLSDILLTFLVTYLFFSFFFLLHCRASTGHGRSTLEMCESKRVKLELLAGVFSPAGKQKNQTKTNNKNHNIKKQSVKILAKVVKPARPLKPLRSSLPPCSMSVGLPSHDVHLGHGWWPESEIGPSRSLSTCPPSGIVNRA